MVYLTHYSHHRKITALSHNLTSRNSESDLRKVHIISSSPLHQYPNFQTSNLALTVGLIRSAQERLLFFPNFFSSFFPCVTASNSLQATFQ
jgi:hypothetical protein